ncbi:MAG: hypothetical protein ACRC0X_02120 [Brevinema sp.]
MGFDVLSYENLFFFWLYEYLKKDLFEGMKNTQSAENRTWLDKVTICNSFYEPLLDQTNVLLSDGEKYIIEIIVPVFKSIPEHATSRTTYLKATVGFNIIVADRNDLIGVRNPSIVSDDPQFQKTDLITNERQRGYQALPTQKLAFLRAWLVSSITHKLGKPFWKRYPQAKQMNFICDKVLQSRPEGMNMFNPFNGENVYAESFFYIFEGAIGTEWYGTAYPIETINTEMNMKFQNKEYR